MQTSNRLEFYQRNSTLAIIILLFLTILSFSNLFANEYVWDDFEFIVENPSIRSLSHIPGFFTESVINLYRPLRTTLYALTYSVFETNPIGYHLIGLGLHTLVSLLIFLVVLTITRKSLISLLVAGLFALHPVHTEAVTFMTAGFDLLGPFFYFLGFYCLLRQRALWLVSLLYLLALFSSEMCITFPLIFALYLFVIEKKPLKTIFFKSIPLVMITALYLWIRFVWLEIGARDTLYLGNSGWVTFFTMTRVCLEYLRLLFWPFPLLADYRHFPLITNGLSPIFLLSALVLLSLTALVFLRYKKNPWLLFAWCWLWFTLLPVLNILPTGNILAERYLYIPSAALCFALLGTRLTFRKPAQFILIGILGIGSFTTYQRNHVWKNEQTLWTQTALTAPTSFVAHNNLASYYIKKGFINNAYDEIQMALKLKPDFVDAHTNLGALYEERNLLKEAEQAYQAAIRISPQHASALNNLGNIYQKKGEDEKAKTAYLKSKQSNRNFYLADYNLGNWYFKKGDLNAAKEHYHETLRIKPDFANAHFNLSVIYLQEGEKEKAIRALKKVIELLPHDQAAKQMLSQLL